jgi:6-phosphogluconolactonase (cycloisomerase 2 family)
MYVVTWKRKFIPLMSAAITAALLTAGPGLAQAETGDVYVLTNQATGNSILIYHRDATGALTLVGNAASGGNGLGTGGDPLGSQNSLVLSDDARLLLAVNAGSNSLSVLAASGDQLRLLNTVPSGGTMPVSVAVHGDLVYVVNSGGTPNITGFRINALNNQLVPLTGSTQNLPGGTAAAPAQVSFSPDGSVLIVTEKGTNSIDSFVVAAGIAHAGVSFPSSGITPFGFAFGPDSSVIVSDAGTGAASSYRLSDDGTVVVITPALADTQNAACWLVVPRNARYAYAANAGSGTISSYIISADGSLALLNPVAASLGSGNAPLDMALSVGNRYLYVRNGAGTVVGYRVATDGSLTPVTSASGVPPGAQGVAAR